MVTGTRAEYGILHRLINLLNQSDLELRLVVTGTHLSAEHGFTVNEIISDEHKIDSKIEIITKGDSQLEVGLSLAKAVKKFTNYFTKSSPDIVLILGDRYEMLGVASAATICRIPIAHLHGGEITLGAIDESIRHSITLMSELDKNNLGNGLKIFVKKALPLTILTTIFCLIGLYLLNNTYNLNNSILYLVGHSLR